MKYLNYITHTDAFQELKKQLKRFFYFFLRDIFYKVIFILDNEVKNACLDSSDPRTYQAEEVAGAASTLPEYMNLINYLEKVQNQLSYKNGGCMCVPTSSSMGLDILGGELELDKKKWLNGESLASIMFLLKRFGYKTGAWLIDGPKTLKERGYISGYYQVNTIQQIKEALSNFNPVIIWTNAINFSKTYKTGVSVPGTSSGHCILCIGHKDDGFIIADPWKAQIWTLRYEDFKLLFNTKLVITRDPLFTWVQTYIKQIKREDLIWTKGNEIFAKYRQDFNSWRITESQWKAFQIAFRRAFKMNFSELLPK